jgi:hypothetical protein
MFEAIATKINRFFDRLSKVEQKQSEQIVRLLFDAVTNLLDQKRIEYSIDDSDPLFLELLFHDETKIIVGDYEILYVHKYRPYIKKKFWQYESSDLNKYELYPITTNFNFDEAIKWIEKHLGKDLRQKNAKSANKWNHR